MDKDIISVNGQKYEVSKYQYNIFDTLLHTPYNIVVEACAGSGKTTTIIKMLDFIENSKKILFVAFNKDIVSDIKGKIINGENIHIRTLHSLGLNILTKYFEGRDMVYDNFKYITYFKNNIYSLTEKPERILDEKTREEFIENTIKLLNFGRYNLSQTEKDLQKIEDIYKISSISDEKKVAIKLMEWGMNNIDKIDFTDMIWLPNALLINNKWNRYDYIILDEAQDANMCQFELLQKCKKMGCRMIIVGDKNQSIYSFAGSSQEVMNNFKDMPNTKSLPLSITYRCPKKIVDFVNENFKNIVFEARPNAPEGIITHGATIKDLRKGDTVLCRTNAPLAKIYMDLLKEGKKSYISGREIGENMIDIINSYKNEKYVNVNVTKEGLIRSMYIDLFKIRNLIAEQHEIDIQSASNSPEILRRYDMIKAIEIITEKNNTVEGLKNKIKEIFSDIKEDGILLSTVHKAKGLTFDNVFICCPSLIPSKRAKQQWEIEEENHIAYVAYTRAKHKLSFMSETGFEYFVFGQSEGIYTKLKEKERLIYGKLSENSISKKANVENYKEIINNPTSMTSYSMINKITLGSSKENIVEKNRKTKIIKI